MVMVSARCIGQRAWGPVVPGNVLDPGAFAWGLQAGIWQQLAGIWQALMAVGIDGSGIKWQ